MLKSFRRLSLCGAAAEPGVQLENTQRTPQKDQHNDRTLLAHRGKCGKLSLKGQFTQKLRFTHYLLLL